MTKSPNAVKLIAGAVIFILLSGVGYFLYSYFKSTPDVSSPVFEPINVEVDEVQTGSLTRRLNVVGSLSATQTVVIKPQTHGKIAEVFVNGGEDVEAGDKLFKIEDAAILAELKEAQAKLSLATMEFNRASKLQASNFGPAARVDKARADKLAAEASVDVAKTKLGYTVIAAPFEGIVGLHKISVGATVNEQTEMLTLTDIDPIKVDFKVPAKFLKFIGLNQRITMTIDGFDQSFNGSIDAIDAQIDRTANSVALRASIPNSLNLLKPGLFAKVEVVIGSKDNTIIVPESAIESTEDESFVYIVLQQKGMNFAVKTKIETGIQEGDSVEVIRGLKAGDTIITVGINKVRHGYPIKFRSGDDEQNLSEEENSKDNNADGEAEAGN